MGLGGKSSATKTDETVGRSRNTVTRYKLGEEKRIVASGSDARGGREKRGDYEKRIPAFPARGNRPPDDPVWCLYL
jgi:hypothetical protein